MIKALDLGDKSDADEALPAAKPAQLRELVSRLAEPQLEVEQRLELVEQLREHSMAKRWNRL